MKFLKKLKNEDGQALIIVTILLVVLLGFAALVIDVGLLHLAKTNMQNAADAGALAGAKDLTNAVDVATSTAETYARANAVEINGVTDPDTSVTIKVTTPYNGDSNQIEVVCTEDVQLIFARVLGFNDINVSARAVAEVNVQWEGDALPFINLDDDYKANSTIEAWESVSPGEFESIVRDDKGDADGTYSFQNPDNPDTCYFKVNYENGVMVKSGMVSSLKNELDLLYKRAKGQHVYVISLKSEIIQKGEVLLTDGTIRKLTELKNNDMIDPSQMTLLDCIFESYNKSVKLTLTYVGDYDVFSGVFPPDYEIPDGGISKLVE